MQERHQTQHDTRHKLHYDVLLGICLPFKDYVFAEVDDEVIVFARVCDEEERGRDEAQEEDKLDVKSVLAAMAGGMIACSVRGAGR